RRALNREQPEFLYVGAGTARRHRRDCRGRVATRQLCGLASRAQRHCRAVELSSNAQPVQRLQPDADPRADLSAVAVGGEQVSNPIFHLVAGAPKPVGPYSHVVEADGWLFVTGQLATDPDNDDLPIPDGIEAQTHKVFDNLKRALAGAGA